MNLTVADAVRDVLSRSDHPIPPSQIRDQIKLAYPYLYQTEAHRLGIERGNFSSFDHALLHSIYGIVTKGSDFVVDRSSRPMLVSLAADDIAEEALEENYESEVGIVYVLSTGMYTAQGKRIVKIGHTTQPLSVRISQLYTTGTPFQFEELHSWKTTNYVELEQAMHRLLTPFRINRAREFFTEDVLQFVSSIAETHSSIQSIHRTKQSS